MLPEGFQKVLINYLSSHLSTDGNAIEYEIRFGSFSKGTNGATQFKPTVDIAVFHNLQKMLVNHGIECEVLNTIESIYSNGDLNCKKVLDTQCEKLSFMTKKVVKNYNVYDYNVRLSMSEETTMTQSEFEKMTGSKQPSLIRKKLRHSYTIKTPVPDVFVRYDFTVVNDENHELEIEIIKNTKKTNEEVQLVMQVLNGVVTSILQTQQSNYFILKCSERRAIVDAYRQLTKVHYFIGAQPETLQHYHLHSLTKEPYSVTAKLDGERFFMFVDMNGEVYLLDNNIRGIKRTGYCAKSFANTLLDGEVVTKGGKFEFHAFDILYYKGQNLRGSVQSTLRNRLVMCKDVMSGMSELYVGANLFYIFFVKEYIFGNVFIGSKTILEYYKKLGGSEDNLIDGLIFTPVNDAYPTTKKWQKLLKWKPLHKNTIDFYAEKQSEKNKQGQSVWKLYVQKAQETKDKFGKQETSTVLFDLRELMNVHEDNMTYMTSFPDDLIDPATGCTFMSNTVIEFVWDVKEHVFLPIRSRMDKTVDPKKHGNYYTVACSIWKNIQNPVTEDTLTNFNHLKAKQSEPKDNHNSILFKQMRSFHNKTKQTLYNKYTKESKSLLELCAGKGGDLHKWMYNNIKVVDGYDIDKQSIEEANRRISTTVTNTLNCKYTMRHCDLSIKENLDRIVSEDVTYDNVSCQFALHYFYNNQETISNFINFVSSVLKEGGYFFGTAIDKKALFDFLGDEQKTSFLIDNQIIYNLEIKDHSEFAPKLYIYTGGNNYLSNGSDEFVIDFDVLQSICADHGLEMVQSDMFTEFVSDSDKLAEYEKDISFLYKTFVFQKAKTPRNDVAFVDKQIDSDVVSQPLLERSKTSIDLNTLSGVKIVQIDDLYCLLKLLNFKKYTYNVLSFENISELNGLNTSNLLRRNIIFVTSFSDPNLSGVTFEKFTSNISQEYIVLLETKYTVTKEDETIETNKYSILLKTDLTFSFTEDEFKSLLNSKSNDTLSESKLESDTLSESKLESDTLSESKLESDTLSESKLESDTLSESKLESDTLDGETTALRQKTVKELKVMLKKEGKKTSGNKDELVMRLLSV